MFKSSENPVNLHVFSGGWPEIERMVRFRDRLRSSKDDREPYARTKRALADWEWKYTHNCIDAKTGMVKEVMSTTAT